MSAVKADFSLMVSRPSGQSTRGQQSEGVEEAYGVTDQSPDPNDLTSEPHFPHL